MISLNALDQYDPFCRGCFPVGVRTVQAFDLVRGREFPCEIWYPAQGEYTGQDLASGTQDVFAVRTGGAMRSQAAVRDAQAQPGTYPLIVFSHSSGGGRRQSTFICTHLSSHGYIVAAQDHSETVAAELARRDGETGEQKTARIEAWMANRMLDVRFLLDYLLESAVWEPGMRPDRDRIGIVGHSFGGWTALAVPDAERRIGAVVALAPAGSSQPKPGMIPAKLKFDWGRDVPTLCVGAEGDVSIPLEGIVELSEGLRERNIWS